MVEEEEETEPNKWIGKTFEDLTFSKELGRGEYSFVMLTKKKGYEGDLCTKIIDKNKQKKQNAEKYLDSEIKILKMINHPNLLKFIEVKKTSTEYFIVTEFYDGENLGTLLVKKMNVEEGGEGKPFSEQIVQYLMTKILSGINYLHRQKIMHRDLKPENIMIVCKPDKEDKENKFLLHSEVKIIDFGFARVLKRKELAESILGSAPYQDPDILLKDYLKKKNFGYGLKVDIWSLGVLCYELLIGFWPFDSMTKEELESKVKNGKYPIPLTLHEETVDFIQCMLIKNRQNRASAGDLLNHPFLNKEWKNFTPIDKSKYTVYKDNNEEKILLDSNK